MLAVAKELEDPKIWNDPQRAQDLGKEKKQLDDVVGTLTLLSSGLSDSGELFQPAHAAKTTMRRLPLSRQMSGSSMPWSPTSSFAGCSPIRWTRKSAFVDIQAGSGGTEAQDWASMLLRMYIRYCERRGYRVEILEESPGEVAGIKSASIKVDGDYAYGYLRTETGVHRLVRKSPFDSNARGAHVVCERVCLSRSRRFDRSRHQSRRPSDRHLSRIRCGRPARQQD